MLDLGLIPKSPEQRGVAAVGDMARDCLSGKLILPTFPPYFAISERHVYEANEMSRRA